MPDKHRSGLRLDIEGLRAVAIGLVLVYHAAARWLPGGFIGVDVFFVISGFLITGLLVREAEKTGKVSLTRFYARRAKRLLPMSALVLVVAAFVTVWVLPVSQRRVFGFDIVGSALYVVNWVFAGRSVDYAAQSTGVSPVLHYWSLSVEEQFYLVWPLVLVVVVALTRHKRALVRPAMGAGLLAIAIPSLVWAGVLAQRQDPSDFFVTTTRLWELAIGGLVAVCAPYLARLPRWVAYVLGVVGALTVAYAAVTFNDTMPWPALFALVPVLGTAAVIVAGIGATFGPVNHLLSWRPLVWIGGLSYSLYLWHWVVLQAGREGLGLNGSKWGLVLIAVTLVPAWVGQRLIENPIRFSPGISANSGLALAIGAVATLVGVVAGLLVVTSAPRAASAPPADSAHAQPLGAMVLGAIPAQSPLGWPQDSYAAMWPALPDVESDVASYTSADCFTQPTESTLKPCDIGDLTSTVRVFAVGDSKLAQYYDALDFVGRANGWRITMYAKGSCPFSAATRVRDGAAWDVCTAWNDALLAEILKLSPDAVITSQGSSTAILPEHSATGVETRDDAVAGTATVWSALTAANIAVLPIIDNPRAPTGYDAYTCLTDHASDARACAFPRAAAIEASGAPAQMAAAALVDGVATIDLTDFQCPHEQCAPVIGNVIVYRDGVHMTNTYVKTLAPVLAQRAAAAATSVGIAVKAHG